MHNISAGRDIVNCNITEVVGSSPNLEILQQSAEQLADAEQISRQIVRAGRRGRVKTSAICAGLALVFLSLSAIVGYTWLLEDGKLSVFDLVRDTSNVVMGALISTAVAALIGIVAGAFAYSQKDPSDAEQLNLARLRNIDLRWRELRLLGLPKPEEKTLRQRRQ